MANELTGRYRYPLGGNFQTGGGLFADFPMGTFSRRDWAVYWNDFLSIEDFGGSTGVTGDGTAGDWTVTGIGTQTVGPVAIRADIVNGVLGLVPDATDNEGYQIQFTASGSPGELWVPASGRTIAFEARVTAGDWDGQDFFIGLAESSASFFAATGAITSDNMVGFHHQIADSGLIECVHTGTADANETDVGDANSAIFTNSAFHRFGFRITGTTGVEYYLDDVLVRRATMANAFDDGMCITFANVGSGASTDALDIDYVVVSQIR